ncbi:interferon alpha-1/13-like [Ochotona princeps]|uniref:interferon alpha-1/13-like n=1 Tax=Ochotona princeps TaxID=9978 RepID=UPI0027155117|nr:interferon alpha-1/13-like [Ochotona princeps]
MALSLSFMLVLALLSCKAAFSLNCSLPQSHSDENKKTLKNLREMKKVLDSSCIQDVHDFGLPQEVFEEPQVLNEQTIALVSQMIEEVFTLFCKGRSSPPWDKAILRDLLCSRLFRQLNDLAPCVMQEVEMKETTPTETPSERAVQKYFANIRRYLTKKKYSLCAWEIVRMEVLRAMSFSVCMQNRLKKKE